MNQKNFSIVSRVLIIASVVAFITGLILQIPYVWITGMVVVFAHGLVISVLYIVHFFKIGKSVTESVPLSEKIKSIIFLIVVLSLMIGFVVLLKFGHTEWAIIVWGCTVILLVLVMVFVNKAKNKTLKAKEECKFDEQNYIKTTGVVKECNLFTETHNTKEQKEDKRKKRTSLSMYKVKINISGKETFAYSTAYYNKGEKVDVVYEIHTETTTILGKSDIIQKSEF